MLQRLPSHYSFYFKGVADTADEGNCRDTHCSWERAGEVRGPEAAAGRGCLLLKTLAFLLCADTSRLELWGLGLLVVLWFWFGL